MDMEERGFLEPFQSVGITPPRGRHGHSVPIPKPLQGSKLVLVAGRAEDRGEIPPPPSQPPPTLPSFPPKANPPQFHIRRDHSLGGSVSRLDRIRVHQEMQYQMESFAELEEEGGEEAGIEYLSHSDSDWPYPSPQTASSDMPSSRVRRISDTLDNFTGDSLLHFSFNPGGNFTATNDPPLGGSFVRAFANQGLHTSLNIPSLHQPHPASVDGSHLFPSAARNPNKAIVTIDAQSSLIMMSNEITCDLFGYQRDELIGMRVQNLFTEPYRAKQHALVERNIDSSGKEVLVSGKVMDAVTSYGVEFPVSVWMKRVNTIDQHPRVIVVMEPVERSSACFTIDQQGLVISCDPWFASLFGYPSTSAIMGQSVLTLVPSLTLPRSLEELPEMPNKQAVTGRTKDNAVFPLTIQFTNLSQNLSVGDLYSPSHASSNNDPSPASPSGEETPKLKPRSMFSSSGERRSPVRASSEPPDVGVSNNVGLEAYEYSSHPLAKGEAPVDEVLIGSGSSKGTGRKDYIGGSKGDPPSTNPADDIATTKKGEIPGNSPSDGQYNINAKATVYAALSGMVSFLPDGMIHGCNHHFSLMLFGYSQEELLKKDITFLIPDFYNHVGFVDDRGMPFPLLDEEEEEDLTFHSIGERSFTPEGALDYSRGRKVSPSPRKRSHELQRSPARKPNINKPSDGTGTSPQHNTGSKGGSEKVHQGVISAPRGAPSMPTLIEVEEKDTREKLLKSDGHFSQHEEGVKDALMQTNSSVDVPCSEEEGKGEKEGRGGKEGEEEEGEREKEQVGGERGSFAGVGEGEGGESRRDGTPEFRKRREGRVEGLREEGDIAQGPTSSTPASKSSDSLPQMRASDSFHEMLGTGSDFDRCSVTSVASLPEGLFEGYVRHKDGSLLAVLFQLKCIALADNQSLFCMWVCRDLDRDRARNADLSMSVSKPAGDPYWTDQMISPEVTAEDATGGVSQAPPPPSEPQPLSMESEETLALSGVYSVNYDTLRSMGKGAFGFVRLAKRKDDDLMVVVKFLRKSSVLKDCWVDDEQMGMVALEISILARLSHPNVVMLLEAYENEHYFQLVMEKHGDGLDLFEFIERNPKLTEPLMSYMFRQMVAGLAYLHGKNILHRDVKDENIIMDRNFHLKLIDFGSAAFMEPGKLFNTFCGTLEYCSPEVLLGNRYSGPELEMWALGVTLYTLVFGENPFFDVEETISGHLQPRYLTSPGLMKVLFWLLHPHPKSRATLKDLQKDKWVNQAVDISQYDFDSILGYSKKGEGTPPSYGHAPGHEPDIGEGLEQALDEKLHVSSHCKHDE